MILNGIKKPTCITIHQKERSALWSFSLDHPISCCYDVGLPGSSRHAGVDERHSKHLLKRRRCVSVLHGISSSCLPRGPGGRRPCTCRHRSKVRFAAWPKEGWGLMPDLLALWPFVAVCWGSRLLFLRDNSVCWSITWCFLLSDRSRVWAEPCLLPTAISKLSGMVERWLTAAESLYGPYIWGRWVS